MMVSQFGFIPSQVRMEDHGEDTGEYTQKQGKRKGTQAGNAWYKSNKVYLNKDKQQSGQNYPCNIGSDGIVNDIFPTRGKKR